MKTKKVFTGTAVAKALLMFGMVLMLIAIFCSILFDVAKESRTLYIILLCSCTSCFFSIVAIEKHKKSKE